MNDKMAWVVATVGLFLTACQTYQVIPPELKNLVNTRANYETVKSNPEGFQGEIVVWGGEVLQSTRLKHMTELEILQLPVTDDFLPVGERVESKGRFIAYDRLGEIVDPAIVQPGTRVTIVGQVQPPVSTSLDIEPREYPAVEIRDMTVWSQHATRKLDYPYYGPYDGRYYYGYRPFAFWEGRRVESAHHSEMK